MFLIRFIVVTLVAAGSALVLAASPAQKNGSWQKTSTLTTGVHGVAFSPDGRTLATARPSPQEVGKNDWQIWILTRGGNQHLRLSGHTGTVFSLAYSPDGKYLASGGADKLVRLWDLKTGRLLHALEGHKDYVHAVAFSPDSKTVASGSYDTTVKLWEVSKGDLKRTLQGHKQQVFTLAFSPDGKLLASGGGDKNVILWDVNTGERQSFRQDEASTGIYALAFSPDGKLLATGFSIPGNMVKLFGKLSLRNVKTGKVERSFETEDGAVAALAFSPNGQTLASARYNGTIEFFDTRNWKSVQTLSGHGGKFGMQLAFAPDGRLLASAGGDREIKLWEQKQE